MDFENDRLLLETLKDILGDITRYYDEFGKKVIEFPPQDYETLERVFSLQNVCRLSVWSLTNDEFEIFKEKYIEFLNNFRKEYTPHSKSVRSSKNQEYPYFIWHIIFPIKKIYERRPL